MTGITELIIEGKIESKSVNEPKRGENRLLYIPNQTQCLSGEGKRATKDKIYF